jgi:uncharacterized protein YjbJ (UPF0337 family)
MGEVKNKVEGKVKEGAGKLVGDEDMEARGIGQHTVGKAQEGGRKVKGAVEETIGRVAGSPGKQARGRARQA